MLQRKGLKHIVLNAKYHAQEAEIVAQAGRKAAVTIATNMAGRGTDILLGGNPEYMARQQSLNEGVAEKVAKGEEKYVDDDEWVNFFHVDSFYRVKRADWDRIFSHFERLTADEHKEVVNLGGLHIIGTERHEARRIDNQLRGRAGRQGDPGSSRFFLSLEDDLMRIFGSDRIAGLMQRLGMEEGVPIEHGMVTRAIERAQKQVEAQNFSVRKHLLEYDDVMNKQRERVYTLRREILEGKVHLPEGEEVDVRGYLLATAEDLFDDRIEQFVGKDVDEEDWDLAALGRELQQMFGLDDADLKGIDSMGTEELGDTLWAKVKAKYDDKEKIVPRDILTRVERDIMLQIVDQQWKDHLYSLDHLKEGIGLRGYGQRDPLVEYKKESFALFQAMLKRVEEEIVRYVWWLRPVVEREGGEPKIAAPPRPAARKPPALSYNNPSEQATRSPFGGPAPAPPPAGGNDLTQDRGPVPPRVGGDDVIKTVRRDEPKIGRNDPCWCGSGKKFKKCHGA
jgi:preprotein translocase subunit SecA